MDLVTTGMAEVVSLQAPMILAIIVPARISMAAPQVTTGMAPSVFQAAMKAQAGQIHQPEPNPGVNLLQMAAALTLTGIMAAVTAEAQTLILEVAVPHQATNARV